MGITARGEEKEKKILWKFCLLNLCSSGYELAFHCLKNEDYDKIIDACTEEIDNQGQFTTEARLLRGNKIVLLPG